MTIREFIAKHSYKELQGKQIKMLDNSLCYIHNKFFTPEAIRDFSDEEALIKSGRKLYFRLYGGNTPDAELVDWIYPHYEVIDNW